MTRIKVDFNNLVRHGQIRASLRHVQGDIAEGDTVEAFDPAEDLSYEATVVEIDESTGRIYLDPHWEPAVADATPRGDWTFSWTNSVLEAHSATTYVYGKPQHVTLTAAPVSAGTLAAH